MPKAARKDRRRAGQPRRLRELLALAVALGCGTLHALPTLEPGESRRHESSLTVKPALFGPEAARRGGL